MSLDGANISQEEAQKTDREKLLASVAPELAIMRDGLLDPSKEKETVAAYLKIVDKISVKAADEIILAELVEKANPRDRLQLTAAITELQSLVMAELDRRADIQAKAVEMRERIARFQATRYSPATSSHPQSPPPVH